MYHCSQFVWMVVPSIVVRKLVSLTHETETSQKALDLMDPWDCGGSDCHLLQPFKLSALNVAQAVKDCLIDGKITNEQVVATLQGGPQIQMTY